MKTVIVIGAGPAGMMAAISVKQHHPDTKVYLIERNQHLGKKLRLTGGGRCNITANVTNQVVVENVVKNGRFLYSALSEFGPQEIINFFNSNNCPLVEEDHQRMFPKSNQATDIIKTFEKLLRKLNIEIIYQTYLTTVNFTKKTITVKKNNIKYDSLIIATGGSTYHHTGSDGNGYDLARKIGHTITEILPAEVPLVSNDQVIQDKTLMGLSFKDINLKVLDNNKVVRSITHDLIITHFGLSGPAALRASYDCLTLLQHHNAVMIQIDFLPQINLDSLISMSPQQLQTTLNHYQIPKRLINYLEESSSSPTEWLEKLKKFTLSIYTTRGMKVAFVTNGGISTTEIQPKTMKSKLDPAVSFCGEIIDYNAYTGGYNITCALATGYAAGKYSLQ